MEATDSGRPALPVLFRDAHYIAVAKPSGLLVHRTALAGSREAALQQLRDQLGRRVYPVHRLDRATSGVLVFGLSPEAASRLAEAVRGHRVAKRYLAVVRGWTEPSGRIDYPLRPAEGGEPRAAHSGYRRLATVELPVAVSRYSTSRYALLAVCPLTGRRHQIRRHLASIAHPVVGDTTHGDGRHNRMFRERFGLYRLALHAQWVGFRQPLTGEFVSIHCPPPPDLQALGARLGWQRWLGETVEGGAPPGC